MKNCLLLLLLSLASPLLAVDPAATAINGLGIELLERATKPGENTVLSPFSIQTALVMTYAGAEGETRDQMARVLHLANDAVPAFAALQTQITTVPESITLSVANRLFAQKGRDFRPAYLALVKQSFGAPLEPLDFEKTPQKSRQFINAWVEGQTRDRIRDLVPEDGISEETRLVLVNAIYLKAPWAEEFAGSATHPRPFQLADGKSADAPTMVREGSFGYKKQDGYTAVSLRYSGGTLQFVILLPDAADGLPALQKKLKPGLLAEAATLPLKQMLLFLPRFKLEPSPFALGDTLQALGMKSAFDVPLGSANFDGIAPRRLNDYLYISNVFHKAFVEIDEKGTEAAAATAVAMAATSEPIEKPSPMEVRVDRPFLFAIQHRPSGACLFLGRVTDPR